MGAAFLPILGGVVGAGGSFAAGHAQSAAYEAQARIAEQNAKTAAAQGEESLRRGAREEKTLRRQARQFAGSQLASFAASGGTIGGSALGVMADTGMMTEEDADMLRYNTLKEKWGFDVERANHLNEASAARRSAKNAKTAGYTGAFSTLLGTAGQIWANTPAGSSSGSGLQGNNIVVGNNDGFYERYYGGHWRRRNERFGKW